MQQIGVRRLALLAAGAVVLCAGTAAAQPTARQTNVAGVTTSAEPPATFNPIIASDAQLDAYGFPPRPDAVANPTGYKGWAAAVAAERHRLVPQLQQTKIAHGPNRPGSPDVVSSNATSNNWSGYVSHFALTKFVNSSFSTVAGSFIVPAVSASVCNGDWDYSSVWVGLDGWGNPDVLQAGVEADAMCQSSGPESFFAPWYEWYPNMETRITNLTAAAGQSFYIHVWATSATAGHAYLENLSTGQSVSVNFNAPSGTKLTGESAEWILESPTVGGTLATLPQYGLDYFAGATSETGTSLVRAPGNASSIAVALTNGGTTHSSAALLGTDGILFTSN